MGLLVDYFLNLQRNTRVSRVIDSDIIYLLNASSRFDYTIKQDWAVCDYPIRSIKYNCVFVPWVPNYISRLQIYQGIDILSTRFNGCYLARYYSLSGRQYGCHIHTGGYNDKKKEWNNFTIPTESDYIAFMPDSSLVENWNTNIFLALRERTIKQSDYNFIFETWGIISHIWKCYTVIVKRFNVTNINLPLDYNTQLHFIEEIPYFYRNRPIPTN